jgi:hypothetical protein
MSTHDHTHSISSSSGHFHGPNDDHLSYQQARAVDCASGGFISSGSSRMWYTGADGIEQLLPIRLYSNPPQENTMTENVAQTVARERREQKERKRVLRAYQDYDYRPLPFLAGSVVRFVREVEADFARDTKAGIYTYAAIFVNDRWYLTGRVTAGFSTDEFVEWLVERGVNRVSVREMLEPL